MPSIEYNFNYKFLTNIPKSINYSLKYKFLTGIPKSFSEVLKYYFLVFSDFNSRYITIDFKKFFTEQEIYFKHYIGFKKERLYKKFLSQVKSNLIYKSTINSKVGFIKHYDIEIYAIPQIIEIFDILILVVPPNTQMFDILLSGYLDTKDMYDENSARSGISGADGFITSQSSPEIKYSSIAYNFKSAKKYNVPLTWGKEAKIVYDKREQKITDTFYYFRIDNYDDTAEIYTKTKVKKIYVKDLYIYEFLSGIDDTKLQNMKILFKNGSVLNQITKDMDFSFVDRDIQLYKIKDIIEFDIIKERFDIENAKWVIIYFDDVLNRNTYIPFWI